MINIPWINNPNSWLYTISFLIISVVITYVSGTIVNNIGNKHSKDSPPLYDLIHDKLPNLSKFFGLNNILVLLPLVRLITISTTVLQQFFFLYSIGILLRSITTLSTNIPTVSPECITKGGKKYTLIDGGCHDYIFSGHTLLLVISSMIILKEPSISQREKLWWIVYSIAVSLFISMSRHHYTVDVIISWIIGVLLTI